MIYQILDSYGNVRLEYLDKAKAYATCDAMNAMARCSLYTVREIGE